MLSLIVSVTSAQKNKLYLSAQAGILTGDHAACAQAVLSGGLMRKNMDVGIGVATDNYKLRTLPVFAELKRYFRLDDLLLFGYTHLGYNIVIPADDQYPHIWGGLNDRFNKGGAYGEIGVGHAFVNRRKRGVTLSVGYSVKTATEKYDEYTYGMFGNSSILSERRLVYTFNRIAVRIGYRL